MKNKKIELTEAIIVIPKGGCKYCHYCRDIDVEDGYFCGLFMESLGKSMKRLPKCEKLGGGKFLLTKIE